MARTIDPRNLGTVEPRPFFAEHPIDGYSIVVFEGEEGYSKFNAEVFVPVDEVHTQAETIHLLNVLAGNSDDDADNAIAASMFGWHTPAAQEIGPRLPYHGNDIVNVLTRH